MPEQPRYVWKLILFIMPIFDVVSSFTSRVSGQIAGLVTRARRDLEETLPDESVVSSPATKRRRTGKDDDAAGGSFKSSATESGEWINEDELLRQLERMSPVINALQLLVEVAERRKDPEAADQDKARKLGLLTLEDRVDWLAIGDVAKFIGAARSSIVVLSSLYSTHFHASIRERFPTALPPLQYGLKARDITEISSTQALVDSRIGDLVEVCPTASASALPVTVRAIVTDLQAIQDGNPMPTFLRFAPANSSGTLRKGLQSPPLPSTLVPAEARDTTSIPLSEHSARDAAGAIVPSGEEDQIPGRRLGVNRNVDMVLDGPTTALVHDYIKNMRTHVSSTSSSPSFGRAKFIPEKLSKSLRRSIGHNPVVLERRRHDRPRSILDARRTSPVPPQSRAGRPKELMPSAAGQELPGAVGEASGLVAQWKRDSPLRDSLARYSSLNLELRGRQQSTSSWAAERSPSPPPLQMPISKEKDDDLSELGALLQIKLELAREKDRKEREEKARKEAEEKLRKSGGLRPPKRRLIPSLDAIWEEKARQTMYANSNDVLATAPQNIALRRHDFLKVVPAIEWLNDEIVNGALASVDEFVNRAAGITDVKAGNRKSLVLGSFFYNHIRDKGVQRTERMLKRNGVTEKNFLSLDTILVPICESSHWTLMVIRPSKRTLAHMDSLSPKGSPGKIDLFMSWVREFLKKDFKADEWKVVRHEAPMQTNGYDCGVHTITNGMCLALGLNPLEAYSSVDMPRQRLRLAAMLLNGGFKGDFDLGDL